MLTMPKQSAEKAAFVKDFNCELLRKGVELGLHTKGSHSRGKGALQAELAEHMTDWQADW